MMARLGPWRRDFTIPLHALQSELNRMFDEYWNPGRFTTSSGGQSAPMDMEPASWTPVVDLAETADAYVVTAEVPGVDPSSIDLSVTGNVLTLRGIKPALGEEPSGRLHERQFGPFLRQITLSGEFDFEAAKAEARHGVIQIRLPKKEAARARTIPVQHA